MGIFQSKTSTKKRINGNTFLLIITVVLFVVMYGAGMIMFEDKGFAKPQMFLNLFKYFFTISSNCSLVTNGFFFIRFFLSS